MFVRQGLSGTAVQCIRREIRPDQLIVQRTVAQIPWNGVGMSAPSRTIKALGDAGVILIEIYLQPLKMLIWISRMYFMIYFAG